MSSTNILKRIKKQFPEIEKLPAPKLRLVEEALVYAVQLATDEELLTDKEHEKILLQLVSKWKRSPGTSLRAYRLREDLTQKELARRSGIAQANLSAIETNKRPLGLKIAKKLARILRCDYRRLLEG